ncbi:MAG: hypothetical protein R3A51_11745 [Nannocystaceae bacterium]|nr:hypothetical protein [Myxococcales bacterium]
MSTLNALIDLEEGSGTTDLDFDVGTPMTVDSVGLLYTLPFGNEEDLVAFKIPRQISIDSVSHDVSIDVLEDSSGDPLTATQDNDYLYLPTQGAGSSNDCYIELVAEPPTPYATRRGTGSIRVRETGAGGV